MLLASEIRTMDSLKNLLQMVFPSRQNHVQDVERTPAQQGNSAPSTLRLLPAHYIYGRPELDPTDKLNLFRHLTGILSRPSMVHSHGFFSSVARPAPNLGIYARVVRKEQSAKIDHKYFSLLINGYLGMQIVIAAALTALGAAGGSHGAVTVFGAINTVFAGILTFLRGSGLPSRLKFYRLEWKRVREFI